MVPHQPQFGSGGVPPLPPTILMSDQMLSIVFIFNSVPTLFNAHQRRSSGNSAVKVTFPITISYLPWQPRLGIGKMEWKPRLLVSSDVEQAYLNYFSC